MGGMFRGLNFGESVYSVLTGPGAIPISGAIRASKKDKEEALAALGKELGGGEPQLEQQKTIEDVAQRAEGRTFLERARRSGRAQTFLGGL